MMTKDQIELRKLMQDYDLTIRQAAVLMGVSFDTMKGYLVNESSKKYRAPPEARILLLKQQAERRKQLVPSIHKQFDGIVVQLEGFIKKTYDYTREELCQVGFLKPKKSGGNEPLQTSFSNTNSSTEKNHNVATALYKFVDSINDIWIDFCSVDLENISVMKTEIPVFSYQGGPVSKCLLEEAFDFLISLEPPTAFETEIASELFQENCNGHEDEIMMAYASIRKYGEQIEPKTLENMQKKYDSIVNMPKYRDSLIGISVVLSRLQYDWEGFFPEGFAFL